jgi:hypothetical protein
MMGVPRVEQKAAERGSNASDEFMVQRLFYVGQCNGILRFHEKL